MRQDRSRVDMFFLDICILRGRGIAIGVAHHCSSFYDYDGAQWQWTAEVEVEGASSRNGAQW